MLYLRVEDDREPGEGEEPAEQQTECECEAYGAATVRPPQQPIPTPAGFALPVQNNPRHFSIKNRAAEKSASVSTTPGLSNATS